MKEKNQTEKMLLLYVIKILSDRTDYEHTLTSTEITKILEDEYNYLITPKRLSNHLKELMMEDERIQCRITNRKGDIEYTKEDAPEGAIWKDFYFEHPFDRHQLQAIIYNIIFSRHMPAAYKKELVTELEKLNPMACKHNMKNYILEDPSYKGESMDIFYNLEELDHAITTKTPVSFRTKYYRSDKKVEPSKYECIVMPLAIVAGKGDYYLLSCLYAIKGLKKDDNGKIKLSAESLGADETVRFIGDLDVTPNRIEKYTYITRIDRMTDIKVLNADDEDVKEMRKVFDKRGGLLNAQEYLQKNAALLSGDNINATFRLTARLTGTTSKTKSKDCDVTTVIDYFGKSNVTLTREAAKETERGKEITYFVRVNTNDGTLRDFARAHIDSVQILSPEYMKEEMKETLRRAYERMTETP